MQEPSPHTNHLAGQTSPYLLQHLHNPVDWHPWGEPALKLARELDRPILLSIGYSACHWCHVMAHESFEDPATAAVMNECFVNIKVDREERPDLDKIYQTAHALLTRRPGGWPLTVFLDPHTQVPFFAGTYFPPEARHDLPAFAGLCRHIAEFYRERREELGEQNASLMAFLQDMNRADAGRCAHLDGMPLDVARQQLAQAHDRRHGGFGRAPKFPHPTSLERLLRHATLGDGTDTQARDMALFTLERMALGGMNDQIGGGFCRYSVDEQWMIPHFEKMLYDNGQLLSLYADAFAATGRPLFRQVLESTTGWMLREMQLPQGGFCSSLDADSEGEEGRFYVWTREQVQAVLDDDEYRVAAACWGFDRAANFEGRWHPHVYRTPEQAAGRLGLPPETAHRLLESARSRLFQAREQRVRPGRDDKVLVSWNALAIGGLCRAARVLQQPQGFEAAGRALDFIREHLWVDGRLLATSKDGHAHLAAYLDDYVFLIDAILERLQYRWDTTELDFARQLAQRVRQHFAAPAGGFFFTADDHEPLIQRPLPLSDDALPAGNTIAARVFNRLGLLLGEADYLRAAEDTLKAAWSQLCENPSGHTGLLNALEDLLHPVQTLIVRPGGREAAWRAAALDGYRPRRQTFVIPDQARDLPPALAAKTAAGAGGVAWLCEGTHCLPPVHQPEALRHPG